MPFPGLPAPTQPALARHEDDSAATPHRSLERGRQPTRTTTQRPRQPARVGADVGAMGCSGKTAPRSGAPGSLRRAAARGRSATTGRAAGAGAWSGGGGGGDAARPPLACPHRPSRHWRDTRTTAAATAPTATQPLRPRTRPTVSTHNHAAPATAKTHGHTARAAGCRGRQGERKRTTAPPPLPPSLRRRHCSWHRHHRSPACRCHRRNR